MIVTFVILNFKYQTQEVGKIIDDLQYALVPGDFFGVDGLILGNRRAVTCTAASKFIRLVLF